MEFITDIIMSQPGKSLQEIAEEAKKAPKVRSLDEILAAQKAPVVKTASAEQATASEAAETPAAEKPAEEQEPVVEEIKEEPKVEAQGKGKTLKLAKSIDFRTWKSPSDVILAWDQHGSVEKCAKNVAKLTNDPKLYCGLLQVASEEAHKVVKLAAQKQQTTKKASKFMRIAELPKKEKSRLAKYFLSLYPPEFVDALLGEY